MASRINVKSMVGSKVNRILILKEGDIHITKGGNKIKTIIGRCDCGKEWKIQIRSILNGDIKSCGCYSRSTAKIRAASLNKKHGKTSTGEYEIWKGMKQRCLNPNAAAYPYYGGRGIKICDRWINSFENFISDMGERPVNKRSIERIDVNGNYEPSNCMWINQTEQGWNTRRTKWVEFEGETKPLIEWCKEKNLKYTTVANRIRKGWDISRAFAPKSKICTN